MKELKMNNLVIFAIAGAFLCGVAVGQKKDDFARCSSAEECKSNCCLDNKYCSPPVDGTCSSQNMEKACENPQKELAKLFCPAIRKMRDVIPQVASKEDDTGVVPELLGTVTRLLDGVLAVLAVILPILYPLLQTVKHLLGDLDGGLDVVLADLNILLGHLLTKLLG